MKITGIAEIAATVCLAVGCSGSDGIYGTSDQSSWEESEGEQDVGPIADVTLSYSGSATESQCTLDPCGGDPIGDWLLVHACVASIAAGEVPTALAPCAGVEVEEARWPHGTLEIRADGRFESHLRQIAEVAWLVPATCAADGPACRALGSDALDCAFEEGACRCAERLEQETLDYVARGRWALAGEGTLHLTSDGTTMTAPFCASSDELHIALEMGQLSMTRAHP